MIAAICISVATFLIMMAVIIIKPSVNIKGHSVSIYWIVPLVGAITMLASGLVRFGDIWSAMTISTAVNPIKILVLFFSMTIISIYLDCVGFFSYLASKTLKRAGSSQLKLFFYLFFTVSILTIFTSNDIVILTFTPFICYFCKRAKINPIPFLIAEFVAANTFSMLLIIGNPTNIYLAQSLGIDFLSYLKVMCLPTLFGGLVALIMLVILFGRKLKKQITVEHVENHLLNKPLTILGLVHLGVCTLLLVTASYIKTEMWQISIITLTSLAITTIVNNLIAKTAPKELYHSVKRAPWQLVPFMLAMFVIVATLQKQGASQQLADAIGGGELTGLKYGLLSAVTSNIMNNIPMSVLFGSMVGGLDISAVYSTIIGSNIGAYITPIGALAGIMWQNILKGRGVRLSFIKFVGYGVVIAIPVLLASTLGLYVALSL